MARPTAGRSSSGGAGDLLALLRDGAPRTRSELATMTGLSRSTVAQRVEALLGAGLIGPAADAVSTGGRPPSRVAFNATSGLVLAGTLGATYARIGVTDLAGRVLAEHHGDLEIARGPEEVLSCFVARGRELLDRTATSGRRLVGVGIGLPGPVEHATGRPVRPPIMPGWDGYDVVARLEQDLGSVAVVDNDVNVMAMGEHFTTWPREAHLVYVKVGTGIGSGIISDGELRRGAQGAAGDIGHIQVRDAEDVVCTCGNTGCLEAVAGGGALVRQLSARGVPVRSSRDLAALARAGTPEVLAVLREAGRRVGEVLADVVSMINPSVIVVGGPLAETGDHLLAGVREVVYRRSLPLATQHLRIVPGSTGEQAGIVGAAVMVIEDVLSPRRVDLSVSGC